MTIRSPAGALPACLVLALWAPAALGEGKTPRTIGTHGGGVGSVHHSPDGKLLVSAGGDHVVRVCELASGKPLRELSGPSSFTCAVRVSPDGKLLAAGGYESGGSGAHPIYLWEMSTGKELPKLAGHPSGVRRLLYTPDSKQMISGGFDGTVRVWDLATGKELRQIRAHGGAVYSLALASDGKTLASGGTDGARLWDLTTGKEAGRGTLTRTQTLAVAFSPCGKLLASGERETVRLWELATGKEVNALGGYKGELSFLIFSADGRTLYSSSYDKAVRLWEVRTGRMIREMEGHASWVWGISLAPDEKSIASCGYDTKVLSWDLNGLSRPEVKPAKLGERALDACWADLSSEDSGKAYQAVWALAGDPEKGLPMLAKRLSARRSAGALTGAQLEQMIANLDADEFEVREKASDDLEKAGSQAEPLLRRALPKAPSLEARKRMQRVLGYLRPANLTADDLCAIRGVQALEYMGTPEARKVLEGFAREAPGLRLTEESTQALARLAKK
jgi:hypothetical protein